MFEHGNIRIEWRERERQIDINKRDKIIKNMTQKYCDLKKEFDDLYVTTKGFTKAQDTWKIMHEDKKWKDDDHIEAFFEDAMKEIPDYRTGKFKNFIRYKLLSNTDCQLMTGFTKEELIHQAKICSISPVRIFHCRLRIKHYLPWRLHSLIFGYSNTWLRGNFKKTLKILEKKYAKPRLINGNVSDEEQYWTRDRIHNEHTPKFAYQLREIDPNASKRNIVMQDGTYQYSYTIQSEHDGRRLLYSGHKHVSLIKLHIWSCVDGTPIYCLPTWASGAHSDGSIFSAAFDQKYLEKCEKSIRTGKKDPDVSFKHIETIKELKYLSSKLIVLNDHLISDNGYHVNHPIIKRPKKPPKFDDERLSALAAAWRRGCSAIRQTQERINCWCKRNKFCRTKININDMKYVPAVWNVVLADMNYKGVKLMKDNEHSKQLVERLLDCRRVCENPSRYWYEPRGGHRESKENRASIDEQRALNKKEWDTILGKDTSNHHDNDNDNSNNNNKRKKKKKKKKKTKKKKKNSNNKRKKNKNRTESRSRSRTVRNNGHNRNNRNNRNNTTESSSRSRSRSRNNRNNRNNRNDRNNNRNNRNNRNNNSDDDSDDDNNHGSGNRRYPRRNNRTKVARYGYSQQYSQNPLYDTDHDSQEESETDEDTFQLHDDTDYQSERANRSELESESCDEDESESQSGSSDEDESESCDEDEEKKEQESSNKSGKKPPGRQKYTKYFSRKAKGFSDIMKYLKTNSVIRRMFKKLEIQASDVTEYIGKKYQNALARGYLRRVNPIYDGDKYKFELWVHKDHESILLFRNMKSKWKSGRRYDIIVSLYQLKIWWNSTKQHQWDQLTPTYLKQRADKYKIRDFDWKYNDDGSINLSYSDRDILYNKISIAGKYNIEVPPTEKHWLYSMRAKKQGSWPGGKMNPSDFLGDTNKQMMDHLREIRKTEREASQKGWWQGHDVASYKEEKLKEFAIIEQKLYLSDADYPSHKKVSDQKKDIFKLLKKRDEERLAEREKQLQIENDLDPDEDLSKKTPAMDYAEQYDLWRHIWPEIDNYPDLKKKNEKYDIITTDALINFCYNNYIDISHYMNRESMKMPWTFKLYLFTEIIRHFWKQIKQNGYITAGPCPQSLKYLENYPTHEKSWYDLDFDGCWGGKLARIQIICSCRSGEQLPSCCAHGSSALWMIYYAIDNGIEEALKPSKRDLGILNHSHVVNLEGYSRYKKSNKKDKECVCHQETEEITYRCDGCRAWFHPSCLKIDKKDIERDRYWFNIWHCDGCSDDKAFVMRNTPQGKRGKKNQYQ